MTSPYVYLPLEGDNAIRLLWLKKGQDREPLEVFFTQHHLSGENVGEAAAQDAFLAISYTWHPNGVASNEPGSVSCCGTSISVTHNLANLFYRLRDADHDLPIWVDQLCIDQSNNTEKDSQIALMHKIYQQCQAVIFWIGEEDADTQAAFSLLERLPDLYMKNQRVAPSAIHSDDYVQDLGLPTLSSGGWWPLMRLLGRNVFQRLWIVQELVLNMRVEVWCGSYRLPFDALGASALFLEISGWIGSLQMEYVIVQQQRLHSFNIADRNVARVKESVSTQRTDYLAVIFNRRKMFHAGDPESLEQLLGSLRKFRTSSDFPSDRVNALLGIFAAKAPDRRVPKALIPSHTKPHTEVFRDVTRYLLERGSLAILSQVEDPSLRPDGLQMPSWTPNYDIFQQATILGLPMQAAAAEYAAGWHPLSDQETATCAFDGCDTLLVEAYQVDTVALTGPVGDLVAIPLEQFLEESARLVDLLQPYPTGESIVQAFWRTLAAGIDASHGMRPVPDEWVKHFIGYCLQAAVRIQWITEIENIKAEGLLPWPEDLQDTGFSPLYSAIGPNLEELVIQRLRAAGGVKGRHVLLVQTERDTLPLFPFALKHSAPGLYNVFTVGLLEAVPNDFLANNNASLFERLMTLVCLRRRIFTTAAKGYLGSGPWSTERGDGVYILKGARMPFVLRKIEGTENEFRIIGECYVHGIMRGEACQSDGFAWSQIRIR